MSGRGRSGGVRKIAMRRREKEMMVRTGRGGECLHVNKIRSVFGKDE